MALGNNSIVGGTSSTSDTGSNNIVFGDTCKASIYAYNSIALGSYAWAAHPNTFVRSDNF